MITLDKTRAYAKVRGKTPDGTRFEQDGVRFKASGEPVKGQEPPKPQKPEKPPVPESPVKADDTDDTPANSSQPTRLLIPQIPEFESEALRQLLIRERAGAKRQTVIDAAQKELRRRMTANQQADEDDQASA